MNPKPYIIFLICSLTLVSFILTCHLSVANTFYDNTTTDSLSGKLLGDSRLAISGKFYTQADIYFHRGVQHEKHRAFESDPFQLIHGMVCPTDHVHLSGKTEIQEIMPWLDLSIRTNPQNLNSYLVAAFWLSSEANLYEQALGILERAQRNIPYSYEVQLAKGRLFLHTGNYAQAKDAFNAALAFINKTTTPSDEGVLLDKSQALLYRALLHEDLGMITKAVSDIHEMLMVSPDNPVMKQRMINLKTGKAVEPSAHDLLASLLNKQDKQWRQCSHDDNENTKDSHVEECEDNNNCTHYDKTTI